MSASENDNLDNTLLFNFHSGPVRHFIVWRQIFEEWRAVLWMPRSENLCGSSRKREHRRRVPHGQAVPLPLPPHTVCTGSRW